MLSWISENAAFLNVAVNSVMVLVWLVYLQSFLSTLRRHRRSTILINRSVGNGDKARCLVVNMSAEPIYLTSIIADITIDGKSQSAIVTERAELLSEDLHDPLQATAQGPLLSGQFRDMGSLHELTWRGLRQLGLEEQDGNVQELTLTAVAASGHTAHLAAGRQKFFLRLRDGERVYLPATTTTKQLRSTREQRALRNRLNQALWDEGESLDKLSET